MMISMVGVMLEMGEVATKEAFMVWVVPTFRGQPPGKELHPSRT
jgi:hypothetical protein